MKFIGIQIFSNVLHFSLLLFQCLIGLFHLSLENVILLMVVIRTQITAESMDSTIHLIHLLGNVLNGFRDIFHNRLLGISLLNQFLFRSLRNGVKLIDQDRHLCI